MGGLYNILTDTEPPRARPGPSRPSSSSGGPPAAARCGGVTNPTTEHRDAVGRSEVQLGVCIAHPGLSPGPINRRLRRRGHEVRRRGPHSFLRIAATLRIAGRATRGMPRAPDPGAKTNLRGVVAHAARWGGVGRTTRIGFLHSPSLQRAPLQPTRARSRGTQGSHPTTSGTSRGSRRRGNSVH